MKINAALRSCFVAIAILLLAISSSYAEEVYYSVSYPDNQTEETRYEIWKVDSSVITENSGQFFSTPQGTLVAGDLDNHVTAIAVDIKNEFIYWAECDVFGFFVDGGINPTPTSIKRMPFGGTVSSIETLITNEEVFVYDLAIDPYNKNRLYFAGPAGNPDSASKIKFISLTGSTFSASTWHTHELPGQPNQNDGQTITGLVHNRSVTSNGDSLYYMVSFNTGGSTIFKGTHSQDGLTQGASTQEVTMINPRAHIEDIQYGAFGLDKVQSNVPTRLVATEHKFSPVESLNYDYSNFQAPVDRRDVGDVELIPGDAFSLMYAFDPITPSNAFYTYSGCEVTALGFYNYSQSSKAFLFYPGACLEAIENVPNGVAVVRSCGEDNGNLFDTDMDGVPDCSDECPFESGEVEKQGCPCVDSSDNDGDGVAACDDLCPNETGTPENNGCICASQEDSDGDGFKNCIDACPTQAGEAKFAGCPCFDPSDDDLDGLRACEDACPFETGKSDFNGCLCEFQIDSDGDSIQDCIDQCPFDAGEIVLLGCTCEDFSDSNGDGVRDCEEAIDGVITFDGQSCQDSGNDFDSDGDGENNCTDICPNDPSKSGTSDANVCGCNIDESLAPACAEDCQEGFEDIGCGCGITECETPLGDPLLTPATQLNKPPQANVTNRKVIIAFKKFSGASLNANKSTSDSFQLAERRKNKRGKLKVRYRVIVQKLAETRIRRVKRIITRKTTLRLNRLKKGVYSVKYKAQIKRKKKTVSQTSFSPSRTFSIN